MGKLTALAVKAIKEPGRYSDGDGLMLLVKPSGARTWVLRMQANGQRRDFGLGTEPAVTLKEAREEASEKRKAFRAGEDPSRAGRASRAALAAVPTFNDLATKAHADRKMVWRNEKHRAQWLSSLRTHAAPAIGDKPVDKVTAADVRELLMPIWLEIPETARRVMQRIGTVLDLAYTNGHRSSEAPMRAIGKGLPRQPKKDRHLAALPYADVAALMAKLGECDTSGRLALRFLILTAARSGEARGATWNEMDLAAATWTIPASRMKAGKQHVVPLSQAALDVLAAAAKARKGVNDEPIFAGLRGKPLSDMTLGKVLRTAVGGKWTVHGMRTAFRTWVANETDYAGEIAESALAHINPNKVEAAYRRTDYLDKRKPLMADWAAYATAAPSPDQPGKTEA